MKSAGQQSLLVGLQRRLGRKAQQGTELSNLLVIEILACPHRQM